MGAMEGERRPENGPEVQVRLGLPEPQRPAAARLYWGAFGDKLGRVLGPESRALRYVEETIRADHAVVALGPDGGLLGIAGFKTTQGSFAGGSLIDMQAAYGVVGAAWRSWLLARLAHDVDNQRFLIDGICVQPEARGRGIGSQLVKALCDEGRRRGHREIRLEVVDTNVRARQLYERLGFIALRTDGIGPLRLAFRFSAATSMVRPLD